MKFRAVPIQKPKAGDYRRRRHFAIYKRLSACVVILGWWQEVQAWEERPVMMELPGKQPQQFLYGHWVTMDKQPA